MKFRKKEPAMRIPQLDSIWTYRGCTVYIESLVVKEKGVLFVNAMPVYEHRKKKGWFMNLDEFLDNADPVMREGKQEVRNVSGIVR